MARGLGQAFFELLVQQAVLAQHAPPLQQGIEQQDDPAFFLPFTTFAATVFAFATCPSFAALAQHGASQQATLQQAVLHLLASQQPDFGPANAADEINESASTRLARIEFFMIECFLAYVAVE